MSEQQTHGSGRLEFCARVTGTCQGCGKNYQKVDHGGVTAYVSQDPVEAYARTPGGDLVKLRQGDDTLCVYPALQCADAQCSLGIGGAVDGVSWG